MSTYTFDAGKMIFSMPADSGYWRVWEIGADGPGIEAASRHSRTGRPLLRSLLSAQRQHRIGVDGRLSRSAL